MDQKILDALKTINDKLGGTNDPNENWGSLLQEIAQNVGSGGGGGESLIVGATYDEEEGKLTLNKTWAEIDTAINAGTTCKLFADWVSNGGTSTNHVRCIIIGTSSTIYDAPEDPESYTSSYYVTVLDQTGQVLKTYVAESENDYPWFYV